jgi:trans-2,3-dihydro-3-hydroxyanthranilate isomerase
VKHRYFGEPKIDVKAEQGYEMGRPSLLYLNAEVKEGKYHITVGGKVVLVARGELV